MSLNATKLLCTTLSNPPNTLTKITSFPAIFHQPTKQEVPEGDRIEDFLNIFLWKSSLQSRASSCLEDQQGFFFSPIDSSLCSSWEAPPFPPCSLWFVCAAKTHTPACNLQSLHIPPRAFRHGTDTAKLSWKHPLCHLAFMGQL